jgi:hypothetical protein
MNTKHTQPAAADPDGLRAALEKWCAEQNAKGTWYPGDGELSVGQVEEFLAAAPAQAAAVPEAVERDAARWRRLVNASEMAFPVATIADDPENEPTMLYGRKRLEAFIDECDEISDTYAIDRLAAPEAGSQS